MQLSSISFGPLATSTLGFERFFDDVERLINRSDVQKANSGFPPHNIIKLDDFHYVVELAVAGFSKDEIDIIVQDGIMTVKGEKNDKDVVGQYLHRGIGTRSFTKTLTIADTIEVKGAEFKDGILRIVLENVIPDYKKPRKIEISDSLKTISTTKTLLTEDKVVE